MGRHPRFHAPGALYHVISRGNGGQTIFSGDEEFLIFLAILDDVCRSCAAKVFAYCLMSNHFHLLIEIGKAPLENVMRRVKTRFAKVFNKRRGRSGHVFQARYLAKVCAGDRYLLTLLRYIHRNPVKAGLAEKAESWPWSSHRQYVGPIRSAMVDVERCLSLIAPDKEEALLLYNQLMAGPEDDVAANIDEAAPMFWRSSNPASTESLAILAETLRKESGIGLERIAGQARAPAYCAARGCFARLALAAGHSASEIARFLGVHPSAVSHFLRRHPVSP